MYSVAKDAGQMIYYSHLKQWALDAKAHHDPEGKLTFTASDSWITRFKRKRGIRLQEERFENRNAQKEKMPKKRRYTLKVC